MNPSPSCYPGEAQFTGHVSRHPEATHAQLSLPVELDCINPMSILLALQGEEQFFLFESATAEKTLGRYSFFAYQMERRFRCLAMGHDRPGGGLGGGANARLWLQEYSNGESGGAAERCLNPAGGNPFELLFQHSIDSSLRILRLPPSRSIHDLQWQGFQGGLAGIFSYESVRHMGVLRRDLRQLSTPGSPYGQQPEMLFYEVHRFFVIDNASQRLFAVYLAPLPRAFSEGAANSRTGDRESGEHCSGSLAAAWRQGQEVLRSMVADLQEKLRRSAPETLDLLPPVPSQSKQLAAELSRQLWSEDQSEEEQRKTIEALRRDLIAGEGLQVVYSVGRQGPPLSAGLFYRLLRRQNPSPYMFFFKDGEQHIVGTSPETHLSYSESGREACIKPMAGTRPLPQNLRPEELQQIIDELLRDPKERAEHLMLIDLARNDLYTNCEPDSVHTVQAFVPEVFSHVVHIVSELRGRLREGKKPHELFAKTFPAGTLSGAPKVRAIELIDQYEQSPRGFYGGCIGYFNYDGSFDSAIIIRSAWIDSEKTLVRSGSGLVYDSESGYEIREHRQKLGVLSAVMQAILQMDGASKANF